jgi:hypothetical protein
MPFKPPTKLIVSLIIFSLILGITFTVNGAEPTDSDLTITARVVWGEARGESYAGQVAVAEVVRNRADMKNISVRSVVTTPDQFCIGSHCNDECMAAAVEAFGGSGNLPADTQWFVSPANAGSDWVTHPESAHLVPAWMLSLRYVTTIGGHDFYAPARAMESRGDTLVMVLRIGSHGADVEAVQERLDRLGYSVAVDGVFGAETERAVMEFQRDAGIGVDGIVGPVTLAAMEGAE